MFSRILCFGSKIVRLTSDHSNRTESNGYRTTGPKAHLSIHALGMKREDLETEAQKCITNQHCEGLVVLDMDRSLPTS